MKVRIRKIEADIGGGEETGFWPYIHPSAAGTEVITVPRKRWKAYESARKRFVAEHEKLLRVLKKQDVWWAD